jgi:hypothetical protein
MDIKRQLESSNSDDSPNSERKFIKHNLETNEQEQYEFEESVSTEIENETETETETNEEIYDDNDPSTYWDFYYIEPDIYVGNIPTKWLYFSSINEVDEITLKKMKRYNYLFLHNCNFQLGLVPHNVTHIKVDGNFNLPIDDLHNGLIHLDFEEAYYFNQEVNNLPQSLKYFAVAEEFNHSLDYLPNGLETLYYGSIHNIPLSNLPYGIKNLRFMVEEFTDFNIDTSLLPDSIEYIQLGNDQHTRFEKLPLNLKNISIDRDHPDLEMFLEKYPNVKFEIY